MRVPTNTAPGPVATTTIRCTNRIRSTSTPHRCWTRTSGPDKAIAGDQTELAGAILATAVPESPDGSRATVAGTIGVALDLLDTILTGDHAETPTGLGAKARLPSHWYGERAARDILDLARRGRAHSALGALITKQGSHAVQSGAAIALAGTMQAWAALAGRPVDQVTPSVFLTE